VGQLSRLLPCPVLQQPSHTLTSSGPGCCLNLACQMPAHHNACAQPTAYASLRLRPLLFSNNHVAAVGCPFPLQSSLHCAASYALVGCMEIHTTCALVAGCLQRPTATASCSWGGITCPWSDVCMTAYHDDVESSQQA
jgi:hypothetical protein